MIDVKIMHNILITVNAFFAMVTRFAVCACVNQADNNHKNGWHAAAGDMKPARILPEALKEKLQCSSCVSVIPVDHPCSCHHQQQQEENAGRPAVPERFRIPGD